LIQDDKLVHASGEIEVWIEIAFESLFSYQTKDAFLFFFQFQKCKEIEKSIKCQSKFLKDSENKTQNKENFNLRRLFRFPTSCESEILTIFRRNLKTKMKNMRRKITLLGEQFN